MIYYGAYLFPFTQVSSLTAAYFPSAKLNHWQYQISTYTLSVKFCTTASNNLIIELRNIENSLKCIL